MRRASGNDVQDYELILHHQTERAILVSLDEDSERVWIPKSQVEMRKKQGSLRVVIVTMEDHVAAGRGLA